MGINHTVIISVIWTIYFIFPMIGGSDLVATHKRNYVVSQLIFKICIVSHMRKSTIDIRYVCFYKKANGLGNTMKKFIVTTL